MEREREKKKGERMKEGQGGEDRRREREVTWSLLISLGMCGPKPSSPVSGVEEGENSVG